MVPTVRWVGAAIREDGTVVVVTTALRGAMGAMGAVAQDGAKVALAP